MYLNMSGLQCGGGVCIVTECRIPRQRCIGIYLVYKCGGGVCVRTECRIARQRCIGIYLVYNVVLEQSEEYPGKDVLEIPIWNMSGVQCLH